MCSENEENGIMNFVWRAELKVALEEGQPMHESKVMQCILRKKRGGHQKEYMIGAGNILIDIPHNAIGKNIFLRNMWHSRAEVPEKQSN